MISHNCSIFLLSMLIGSSSVMTMSSTVSSFSLLYTIIMVAPVSAEQIHSTTTGADERVRRRRLQKLIHPSVPAAVEIPRILKGSDSMMMGGGMMSSSRDEAIITTNSKMNNGWKKEDNSNVKVTETTLFSSSTIQWYDSNSNNNDDKKQMMKEAKSKSKLNDESQSGFTFFTTPGSSTPDETVSTGNENNYYSTDSIASSPSSNPADQQQQQAETQMWQELVVHSNEMSFPTMAPSIPASIVTTASPSKACLPCSANEVVVTATTTTEAPSVVLSLSTSSLAPTSPSIIVSSLPTIYDIIVSRPDLSKLLNMIQIAGGFDMVLNSTMLSWTLFAPNNQALEQVNTTYLEKLSSNSYRLHLIDIIGYHLIMNETLPIMDIVQTNQLHMSNMETILVAASSTNSSSNDTSEIDLGSYAIQPAHIVQANRMAVNGIVHILDGMLYPSFVSVDLLSFLSAFDSMMGNTDTYSRLRTLLVTAKMESTLDTLEDGTLLAPINSGISQQTYDYLLLPEQLNVLQSILQYHILGYVFNYQLIDLSTTSGGTLIGLPTQLPDATVLFTRSDTTNLIFNDASALQYGLVVNGIVYQINKLLIPPSLVSKGIMIPGLT